MDYLIPPLLVVLVFCAVAVLFRRMGMGEGRFIVYTFIILGTALGLLSMILWPGDLAVYVNVPGTAFGDWLYRSSIEVVGDPHSDQAHYTVPWLLRVPQVYASASPAIYTLIGLMVQYAYRRIRKRGKGRGTEGTRGETEAGSSGEKI